MKNLVVTILVVLCFGTALIVNERQRQSTVPKFEQLQQSELRFAPGRKFRAAGRIQGRTDEIELRARIEEQIAEIHVRKGQWVREGETLIQLDAARLTQERDLAQALLVEAQARRERLENGFQVSEIETVRQEQFAAVARTQGAERKYQRAIELAKSNAISPQAVDELKAELTSLSALEAAAKHRLETIELPPREDERMAAEAAVRAADARLKIAQINLDRATVKSPIQGRVLAVDVEVGELAGPESDTPLVVLSDTRLLQVVAEVDEFDALRVKRGQASYVTADGTDGTLASGEIVEIEPQMNPKRMFGQWAGERNDTYTRRVWIELKTTSELPIGLPVDVYIQAE